MCLPKWWQYFRGGKHFSAFATFFLYTVGDNMRTVALDFPKSILIETLNLCQGNCKFCPYTRIRKNEKTVFFDTERFKELIKEMSNHEVKRITLFNNNEPLLDYRICEFIKFAHENLKDTEITLSTNGILLTMDKLIELKAVGLTTLYISIPTINKENYKEIMGVSLEKLLKLLEKIEDKELCKMIRIAVPKTKYYDHDLMKEKLGKYLICEWDLEYKENWKIDDIYNEVIDFVHYVGPCDRPMDQMVISSNGNVIICCRDWNYQNIVGNVYEKSIYDIWHGKEMKKIQEHIAYGDYDSIDCCKDCNMNKNYYLKKFKE